MDYEKIVKLAGALASVGLLLYFVFVGISVDVNLPEAEQTTDLGSGQQSGAFPSTSYVSLNVTNDSVYSNTTVLIVGCLRAVKINSTFGNLQPQNVSVEVLDEDDNLLFLQNVTNGSLGVNRTVSKWFDEYVTVNVRNATGGSNSTDNANGSKVQVDLIWQSGTYC